MNEWTRVYLATWWPRVSGLFLGPIPTEPLKISIRLLPVPVIPSPQRRCGRHVPRTPRARQVGGGRAAEGRLRLGGVPPRPRPFPWVALFLDGLAERPRTPRQCRDLGLPHFPGPAHLPGSRPRCRPEAHVERSHGAAPAARGRRGRAEKAERAPHPATGCTQRATAQRYSQKTRGRDGRRRAETLCARAPQRSL